MAAIMLQTIRSLYTKISEKCLFISANTYKKYIVCNDYCVAFHNDKYCFVSNCKFHIILFGKIDELLKKLDTFCFTNQRLDYLYALLKYRFSEPLIAKSGQVFDNVQRAVVFNHINKGVYGIPSIVKEMLLRKTFWTLSFSSFLKTKTTQTSGLVFAERIEKCQKD